MKKKVELSKENIHLLVDLKEIDLEEALRTGYVWVDEEDPLLSKGSGKAGKSDSSITVPEQYIEIINEWQNFYASIGYDCGDLSNVTIPDDPGGFERVIIMALGITPQTAYDLCAKNIKCWKYTNRNLDEIIESERTTQNNPYAIRIRNRREADRELRNLSYTQLKQKGIISITLEERLIYEHKYYLETNKHLDIRNWTLCSGSRYSDGDVPDVRWSSYDEVLRVDCCGPDLARDRFRSRRAII